MPSLPEDNTSIQRTSSTYKTPRPPMGASCIRLVRIQTVYVPSCSGLFFSFYRSEEAKIHSSLKEIFKEIFATHGIPSVLVSDNGPEYDCTEMKQFAEQYGFHHTTTSPYYPKANGLAERAVRTVKNLLSNSPDP